MKNPISFPAHLLEPIRRFLKREEKQLEKRKKSLEKEDPFDDPARLTDNASPDVSAAVQFGHSRIDALRQEIDRRLIEIHKALTSLRIGRYGICQECGQMIDTDRLMAKPEATLCIDCEKKKER